MDLGSQGLRDLVLRFEAQGLEFGGCMLQVHVLGELKRFKACIFHNELPPPPILGILPPPPPYGMVPLLVAILVTVMPQSCLPCNCCRF